MTKFGYPESVWMKAKEEARDVLIQRASSKAKQTISYSKLAEMVRAISFDAHDHSFHALLGEISEEEHADGNGMLSVLVVYKNGPQMPGTGFFELARELGHNFSDDEEFWIEEFKNVLSKHEA